MADARQLSVSNSRERRSTADDETSLPCNLTGILVAKSETMMYISNMMIYKYNGQKYYSVDAFKKNTRKVISQNDITIKVNSATLK